MNLRSLAPILFFISAIGWSASAQELFLGPGGQLSNPSLDARGQILGPDGSRHSIVDLLLQQEGAALSQGRHLEWQPPLPPPSSSEQTRTLVHELTLRPDIPGAYRHPLGTQIHSSCLGENSSQRMERVENFNRVFNHTLNGVYNCRIQYPSLAPLLDDWIIQARRGVIFCSNENISDHHALATTFLNNNELGANERQIVGDIPIDAYHWRPGVMLRRDEDVSPLLAHNASTYFHEFLHNTGANNMLAVSHRLVQRQPFQIENPCEESSIQDRMMIIQGLCMGTEENQDPRPNAEDIFYRTSQCGADLGCVKLFTSRNNEITGTPGAPASTHTEMPSFDFSNDDARRLCGEILNTGQCLRVRNEWFNGARHHAPGFQSARPVEQLATHSDLRRFSDPFTRFIPELSAFELALRQRLTNVYPRAEHELPPAFFNSGAQSQEFLAAVNSTSKNCLQSIFRRNAQGAVFLTPLALRQASATISSEESVSGRSFSQVFFQFRERASLSHHLQNIRRVAQRVMENIPACTEHDRELFSEVFSATQNFVSRLDESNGFMTAARARAAGGGETFTGRNAGWLGITGDWLETDDSTREILRSVFGNELMERYTAALERYHPDSNRFMCSRITSRTGVSASQDALSLMSRSNRARSPASCP